MKFTILAALVVLSFSSVASESLKSVKLAGKYEILEKNGLGADRECAPELKIIVNEKGVYALAENDITNAAFLVKDSGCEKTAGDIGPSRFTCTKFKSAKVSRSTTEPVTIVGYISETKSISLGLFDKNILTYENNSTSVPFGIFGLDDQYKFSCKYKRSESN